MAAGKQRHEDHEDIDRRHHPSLGRREPSGQDAAHDDERDHERKDRGARGVGELAERGARLLDADRSKEVRIDHQADADQHTWNDAGQEQTADRDVAGRAIDDRHDARRDEVCHGRGAGDQRRGEGAIVALLGHLRRHGAAQDRDIGRGRAGNAGKEHAEQGDHLRQSAAQMPDQRLRQHDHAVGHVRRRHQLPHEEEERNRQQDFGIDAVKHLADHRLHADWRERACHQHARHQREGDRNAHVAEAQEQGRHQEQDRAVAHLRMPAKSSASSGPSKPWRQPLMICSRENSTISAPAIGTLAV